MYIFIYMYILPVAYLAIGAHNHYCDAVALASCHYQKLEKGFPPSHHNSLLILVANRGLHKVIGEIYLMGTR